MNARVFIKEGRPLFWPWCAVMLTGFVSLIRPLQAVDWLGVLGIVLGVPLLATLPFGNEFQNRTLSLLLSQPVGRVRVWIEKSCIAFLAVASVVLVFAFSPLAAETVPYRGEQAYAVALIVAVLASATFWTLISRSTIGGIALSVGTVLLIAGFSTLVAGFGANRLFLVTHFTAISVTILLCYAGLMFWLGERTLMRYQASGTMAGDDLLTAGSDLLLGAFSNRAQSSPTRPLLNLIRKEFRLLRPVWLIAILAGSAWTCIAFVELLRPQNSAKSMSLPLTAFGLSSAIIVAILAGCLSLGEEKTSGTYAWHRTLPISPARQWSIKLFAALFVSFICAGVIPVLLIMVGRHLFPAAFASDDASFQLVWLLAALFLTLFSFWCACAVTGTVSAVAWVVPILAVVMLTPQIADRAGQHLADLLVSRLHLFANFRLAVFLLNLSGGWLMKQLANPRAGSLGPLIIWIPSLIVAVFQSYRLFRSPIRESGLSVARKLSALVVFALLCGVLAYGFVVICNKATSQWFGSINAVDRAIQSVLSDSANREATQPLQLNADDLRLALKKAALSYAPVSPWLNGSTLTIVPDKIHPTTCCKKIHVFGGSRSFEMPPWWNYTATLHLASGADLDLSFEPPSEHPAAPPKGKISVRWPGKTSEQPLPGRL